jgi:hypothetical protein
MMSDDGTTVGFLGLKTMSGNKSVHNIFAIEKHYNTQ